MTTRLETRSASDALATSAPGATTSEVAALIEALPETSLGPQETWPHSLRTVLRLMLSSRYAMWLAWGPELVFFYNDAYREQTLGAKHPWALGKSARDVWAEIWHAIGPRVDRVLATGQATWEEGLLLFLERSGFPEETYHTFSYSPAPGDDGRTAGLFCVVIEETERVIGERRLTLLRELASSLGVTTSTDDVARALERVLEGTLEFAFSITYLFDQERPVARRFARTVIDGSHPAAPETIDLREASPWPLADLVGDVATGREARVVPLDRDAGFPRTAWGKPPSHAVIAPITQPGRDRPAGVFIAGLNPYRPVDEGIRSFAGLFVGQLGASIENARAYAESKRRAEALAELDRAKTAFFSNVSHEFRTPLTLMLGPLEDALAVPGGALSGDALSLTHRNALRLLRLVNALLDFSRFEAGRVRAAFIRTDVATLTGELASVFRSAVERAGLRFVVDARPIAAPVYVDREMWEKVVLNLLSNALKFTFDGEICVGTREDGDHVVLTVSDTGTGVPAEEVGHLFERFHRVEGAKSRTHEGSGIGLALVSELVKLHGGTVRVASTVRDPATGPLGPGGTTFEVRIPTGKAHLSEELIVTSSQAPSGVVAAGPYVEEARRWLPEAEASPSGEPLPSLRPRPAGETARIVLADDNADMREYVTRLLRGRWDVEAVADGEAALTAIRRVRPALVVSDVMMPKLDGFGLVEALRGDPSTRTIPVLLLSARAGEEATAEGLRAGANDYLIKPFSARELIARVSSQLTIAALREQSEREREAQRLIIETIFNEAPAAIAMFRGPELVIEFANPRIVEVWQRSSASEVLGKPLLDAIPELRGQGFDELLARVMQTGEPYFGNEVNATLRRNGTEVTFAFNFVYVPTRDAGGVIDGATVFAFDVTAQVNARARVELGSRVGGALVTRETLAAQLLHSCEAILGMGTSLARIWTYNAGHDAFELRASAGDLDASLEDQARGPFGPATLEAIGRSREPLVATVVANDPRVVDQAWARRERVVSAAAHPLLVGDRLVGIVALFAKRELPEELLTALATIADPLALGIDRDASERFRELFIGMLGHDLRNPLNAVLMAAHVLTPHATEAQARTLRRIEGSARRMERMITQVLDFTRARAGGGIPIVRSPVDFRVLCEQTIEELSTASPTRKVELDLTGDTEGDWDADRLTQVLSNLVANAQSYGSPDGTVKVQVVGGHHDVRLVVQNHGHPIPADMLPHLFDPFRRATHAKSTGTQGLGLGLFITKQIVVAHGGTISVRSNDAEGTLFSVTIPKAGGHA